MTYYLIFNDSKLKILVKIFFFIFDFFQKQLKLKS